MHYKYIRMRWAGPIGFFCIAWLSAASPQQSEPPAQKTIHVFTDPMATAPEARDLNEQVRQVDAVIVGRVAWSEVRTEPSPLVESRPELSRNLFANVPIIRTDNIVTVVEVLKGHAEMPGTGTVIRINQDFGTTTWNGYTVVHHGPDGASLQVGAEYALLLEWNPYLNQFTLEGNDIFRISSGRVETSSGALYGAPQAGVATEEFLARLRAAAAQLPQNVR
jgi:hypothetical protein